MGKRKRIDGYSIPVWESRPAVESKSRAVGIGLIARFWWLLLLLAAAAAIAWLLLDGM